jgi:hypothetical protein
MVALVRQVQAKTPASTTIFLHKVIPCGKPRNLTLFSAKSAERGYPGFAVPTNPAQQQLMPWTDVYHVNRFLEEAFMSDPRVSLIDCQSQASLDESGLLNPFYLRTDNCHPNKYGMTIDAMAVNIRIFASKL